MEGKAMKRRWSGTSGGEGGSGDDQMADDPSSVPVIIKPAHSCLANVLILEKVSARLPLDGLLSLRPTCTTWNRIFAQRIRQKHPLISIPRHFQKKKALAEPQLLKNSELFPFSNFKYDLDFYKEMPILLTIMEYPRLLVRTLQIHTGFFVPLRIQEIRQILLKVGPQLEKLKLWIRVSEHGLAEEEQLQCSSQVKLPRLRQLEVYLSNHHPLVASLFSECLLTAGALRQLALAADGSGAPLYESLFLSGLANISLERLEMLEITGFDLASLSAIRNLAPRSVDPLRLVGLKVSFDGTPRSDSPDDYTQRYGNVLLQLLRSQAPTLKRLLIVHVPSAWINTITVPKLEFLKYFEFGCGSYPDGDALKTQLEETPTLTDAFPQLECIRLEVSSKIANLDRAIRHDTLTELHFSAYSHEPFDSTCFLNLATLYPSVTRLELTLRGEMKIFVGLLAAWPRITELKLNCSSVCGDHDAVDLDKLVSGVPVNCWGRNFTLSDELESRKIVMKIGSVPAAALKLELENLWRKNKTQHGLGDMRELRKLELQIADRRASRFSLTDIGGFFGLAILSPTLKHLTLVGRERESLAGLSNPCRRLLDAIYGENFVIRVDPTLD